MSESGAGRPPTAREGGAGRPPTTREGGAGGDEGWVPIPGSLQLRFRYVRSLSSGGEANLYLVEDAEADGCEVLLKLYNTGIVLNEQALKAVQGLSRDHVVGLFTWGRVAETGQWFEVQEFLHVGDLAKWVATTGELVGGRRRLPQGERLLDVVAELLGAVSAFHEAGLSHHDIKPTNVLVRSVEPTLDLVLADFGLSIASDRTVFLSKRAGTSAYDSPESLGAGQGGPKRDFWALGMTIAEVAGGRHPFSQPSDPSVHLADQAIRDHLYHRRPIDLSAIDDLRVRRLCEGLTRYDEANRWGAEQVEAWLQGDDPEVVGDRDPTELPRTGAGVEFAGAFHTSRRGLAAALSGDWRAAVGVLGTSAKRKEFFDLVASAFGSGGLDELEAAWAASGPGVDRAVIDVIVALDPVGAPPVVKGWEVSAGQLAPLARSVAADDEKAAAVIEPLYGQHCLEAVAGLAGHETLAGIDQQWHQAVEAFQQHCDLARSDGVQSTIDTALTRAALLGAVADDSFARTLRQDRDRSVEEHPDALRHDWFVPLAEATDPAAALAARTLAQAAATQARENELREQQLQEQQRSEQARAAASRAARYWPRDGRLLRGMLWVCLSIVPALVVGYFVVRGDFADRDLETLVEAKWFSVMVYLWIEGTAAIAVLTALLLAIRFHWPDRHRGMAIATVLVVVGGASLMARKPIADQVLKPAREALFTTPISPRSVSDSCSDYSYWTSNGSPPTRTFVTGESCNTISQFSAWAPSWQHVTPGSPVGEFTSMDGTYITTSGSSEEYLEAVSSDTGGQLWMKDCPSGWTLDTSQKDDRSNTPTDQKLGVACGSFGAWISPNTGQ